jgi:hypothetical protein
MTCEEARERLVDDSEAAKHASACADCAAWLQTQRAIAAECRALSRSMGVPRPEVEAVLRARFRAAARKPRTAPWVWAAAAALAIGIGVGAWFSYEKPAPVATVSPAPIETAGEFVLLDYGRPTPGLTAGRLVRVTLPPSAPAWFGLPVDPRAREGIEAEVLLGDDGVAQAVRLVRSSGR